MIAETTVNARELPSMSLQVSVPVSILVDHVEVFHVIVILCDSTLGASFTHVRVILHVAILERFPSTSRALYVNVIGVTLQ